MPATSKAQQRLMGMAYAYKKGELDSKEASQEVKDLADSMTLKQLKKYAATKHEGLPDKVDDNLQPGDVGGMGQIKFPTATETGSGDMPAGQGDAEEEYEKKRRKMKYLKNFESFVNEAEYYGVDRDTEMRAAGIGASVNYMPSKNSKSFVASLKKFVKPSDIQSLSTSRVTIKPGSKTFMTFNAKDGFNMGQVVEILRPGLERMSKVESLHFFIQEIDANSFSLSAKKQYDTFTDDYGKELNIDKSSSYYIG